MVVRKTELADRMRDAAQMPRFVNQRDELLELAKAFDDRTADFYAEPQRCTVQQFMSAWSSARRLYYTVTGSPLI